VQYGAVTRDWFQAYGQILAGIAAPVGALAGKSPPAQAAPPASPRRYVGVYANDYFGPAEIVVRGDALALKIGPLGRTYALRHWDGSVFVYTPDGENAPDGSVSAVTFAGGASGRASSLSIELYASSGRSVFTRLSKN
jgi:hypothetical protein